MHRYRFKASASVLALLLGGVAAPDAFAQEAAPPPTTEDTADSGLAEIIVTAQRRSQSLQDVPVAVSALSNTQLETAGIVSTDALQNVSPGLSITRQLAGAVPYIRGVGTQSVSAGNEAAVALYVDGVYYQSPYANIFSFNNIDRVEVLRGPQGTLFGRNATGGLVHVITRDPQAEPTMRASVSYGNYKTVEASAYASGGSDRIAVDIAAQIVQQNDGFGRNLLTGAEVNYQRERGVRSKIKFTPSSDLTIILSGDYSRLESDLGIVLQPIPNTAVIAAGGDFYDSVANLPQSNKTDWYGGSLSVEYAFGDLSVKSLTAYRKLNTSIRFDQDATSTQFADILLDQKDHSFQQELLLQGKSGPVNFTAGIFYFKGEGAYSPLGVRSISPASNFDLYSPLGVESIAGFGQIDFEISDATTITAGARYTRDKRDNTPTLAVPGGDLSDPADVIQAFPTSKRTFSKPTWRFAISHKFTDDLMLYASYNRGFKSGVFSTSAPGSPPVEPETLDAFEGGLRSEWLDRRLRFNLTGFYYNYKNIQLNSIVGGASLLFNAAKGRSHGIEFETSYLFDVAGGELTVSANGAYLNAKYNDFPNGPVFTPIGNGFNARTIADLSGNRMIHAPKWSHSLSLNYETDLGGGSTLQMGGSYFHSSSFFWEPDNRATQPTLDLFNAQASIGFDDGKFRLRIFGRNLTNKKYYSYLTESTLGDKGGPAAPRTYGVGFDVNF